MGFITLGQFMINDNNPATRLYNLLQDAAKRGANKSTRSVWATVLGVSENDAVGLLRKYSRVCELVVECKKLIATVPDINQQLYLDSFPAIETILDPNNFPGAWNQHRQRLQEKSTLQGLAFCAELLSRTHAEEALPKNEISEFLQQLATLSDEISKSSAISDELRGVLVEQIELLRAALLDYRINGAAGVITAVELTAGRVLRNAEEYQATRESTDLLHRMEDTVSAIDRRMSKAKRVKQLTIKVLETGRKISGLLGTGSAP